MTMSDAPADNLLMCFYGDDFTGSTDAMESLTLAGVRTVLFVGPPGPEQLAAYPGVRAAGVAGLTRSMTPDAMEAELRPAFASLKSLGSPLLHYKVCSTFDSSPQVGSIGRAIDVGRSVLSGAPFVPLLVGAPALGRYCVFGNLFARAGADDAEIYRLDRHPSMSLHPTTPADESDLRRHLARQTDKRVALFDILKLALPDHATRRAALDALIADRPEVVLFDVLTEPQLAHVGRLTDAHASHERPLFVVGSSGVEAALGAHWRETGVTRPPPPPPQPGPAQPLLVVSGSCSPVTERQIEWALSHGFEEVAVDTIALTSDSRAEASLRRATEQATARLASGRHVIVHTARGRADARVERTSTNGGTSWDLSRRLGEALAAVVRAVVARAGVRRVLIAGGDTSGYLARALGVESLEMIAPLTPGAPLCRARAPGSPADGLELNFKGGQVGGPDYFATVARGHL